MNVHHFLVDPLGADEPSDAVLLSAPGDSPRKLRTKDTRHPTLTEAVSLFADAVIAFILDAVDVERSDVTGREEFDRLVREQ